MTLLTSRKVIKELEIVNFLLKAQLDTEDLKSSPIREGQYRFKVYVAVGNRRGYVRIGKNCEVATLAAERMAKL